MRTLFLPLLLVFLFPQVIVADDYFERIGEVDSCLKNEDWVKAESLLLEILKTYPANPNNYLLLSNLGTVHRNLGKTEEALEDYTTALVIAPRASTIRHNRASLLLEMDSVKRAFEDYKILAEQDTKDIVARNYIGMIALEYGEMDLSLKSFEEVLNIDDKNTDALRGKALWLRLNGNFEEASALYTEIIRNENRQSNYLNRAECYIVTGRYVEAANDLSEAQKLDPSVPDIYLLKARLAYVQYRYDDAVGYAKQALSLGAEPELVEPFLIKKQP